MRLTKEKLTLKYMLTDDEKVRYSEEQSKAFVERSEKKAQLKTYSGELEGDISSLDAKIMSYANKINNGYEHRAVECKIEYDWDSRMKRWLRFDTGEIAKEDIIPENELQEEAAL